MTEPAPSSFEKNKPGTAERSRTEAKIEDLRQQGGIFVDAVRATRMPMAVTDPNLPGDPIIFANDAFLALSGYSMEEVLGQQPHFLNGPETDPDDARRFRNALAEDRDEVVESVQYRKDGSRFVAAVFLSAFKDREGRTLNHFLSYLDITRRVEAELTVRRQAAELERSIGERTRRLEQTNERLSITEERLRSALQIATVGILFWGPDLRLIDVNDAFLHFTGFSREEALGLPWQELTPPEFHPASERAIAEVRESGEAAPYEKQYFRKDGSRWWGLFASRAIPDGAVEFVLNVDDRKATEEALRQSEERYRLIVENAKDYAIIISDADDIIVDWLPGAEAVFGWTRDEVIGRPGAITFTPRDQEAGAAEWEIETAAREGAAPDVRWHQRKDGGQAFIEGTVTPLRNEDGSIRGYLKIGQDVSDRRSAQEALEISERRMRALVTGMPQMVFRSWGTGARIWGSPQWIEYTGLTFERSLGFGWLDAIHPDDRQASMDGWQGAEERGEYYVEHRILNAATGQYRWHQTRAVPARSQEGRVLEWVGTSNDVEELRQLHRHQQTLLGELQHRVRNTLGVIRSIARRTAATSDDVEEMAMHLEGRIGAFSRVQAVVTRSPDAGVDLAAMIEDELLAHAAREGEALKIEGPEVILKPRPAETISLAIHELATNAVKYGALGADGGRIDVTWERTRQDGTELLNLVWEENGVEQAAAEPKRRGFGLELLQRTLPYELGGETRVEFRPEGLRFAMAVPLEPALLAE